MPGPYELYLIRHGLAEERGDGWPDDAKRPLSDAGVSRMRKIARGLARLGVSLDIVLTSPLVRARQTAEIVVEAMDPHPQLVKAESLAPGGAFASVSADLEKHARRTRIAMVGHEPALGELAARFIGARRPLEFKKGAICRIDVDTLPASGPGALRWFLTPGILRRVKR